MDMLASRLLETKWIRATDAGPLAAPWILFFLLLSHPASAAPSFRAEKLEAPARAITNAIAEKDLPGAVLWIERQGLSYHRSFGQRALKPVPEAMTEETIFDLASLTKVVATTPAVMLLLQRGQLHLDDLVRNYIPEFRGEGTAGITLRQLLTHTSGLRPGLPAQPEWSGYSNGIALACLEKTTNAPGTEFRYSDINFILLGEVVRRVSGRALEEFTGTEIYQPLRMFDTTFRPGRDKLTRIAPTQETPSGLLRGQVHDPTARRMGGVAGHAGLFSTAHDLARYARLLLNGGQLEEFRLFTPQTVKLMTTVQSPEQVLSRRGLGWDIDSPYSRPRGALFPRGSFGHTGWTGTALWIDPFSQTFWIFLSNRIHPDGKGSVLALYSTLGTLAAEAVEGFEFTQVDGALAFRTNFIAGPSVNRRTNDLAMGHPAHLALSGALNGIDVLERQNYAPLRKQRIGLVTNQTGQDRWRNPTVDLLFHAPEVQLRALFSPEHGIRGALDEAVADGVDEPTGLPIYSLYPRLPARKQGLSDREYNTLINRLRSPPATALSNLDALVFDIQDVGCRFYTYVATLGLCLEAAGQAGIRFIVLDRVNPITGNIVEGPVYDGDPLFVAWPGLPLRHGMTLGELAAMFNAQRELHTQLTVIPIEGWTRGSWFDATGQPWRNPSLNMRSLNAATLYPGIGLHETALSVGRGTETPFEIVGAPYINDLVLAAELNHAALPGIRFIPARFTPAASTFKGQECGGVSMVIVDRQALRTVDVGILLAVTLRRLYPAEYPLDKIAPLLRDRPTLDAIRAGAGLDQIKQAWAGDLEKFRQRRAQYLLYR